MRMKGEKQILENPFVPQPPGAHELRNEIIEELIPEWVGERRTEPNVALRKVERDSGRGSKTSW